MKIRSFLICFAAVAAFSLSAADLCHGTPAAFDTPGSAVSPEQVFPERRFRIMSYNLRFGERASMDELAEIIKAENPDFVSLQEVDVMAGRIAAGKNRGLNYINELAQKTGMFGYFGRAIDFAGGYYGIGILSRIPAKDIQTVPLPNPKNAEARVMLKGTFLIDGKQPFVFASTHLDFTDLNTTELQARYLLPRLTADGIPAIIGGDFNATPADAAVRFMAENGAVLSGSNPTFPSDRPRSKIDHLFGYPDNAFILEETHEGAPEKNASSDHLPIISTVILKSQK